MKTFGENVISRSPRSLRASERSSSSGASSSSAATGTAYACRARLRDGGRRGRGDRVFNTPEVEPDADDDAGGRAEAPHRAESELRRDRARAGVGDGPA